MTVNSAAQPGTVALLGSASADLDLQGYGNVVLADPQSGGAVTVRGGTGLSTLALGDGPAHVDLKGAFNTVVLGNGDNVVVAGDATATLSLAHGIATVAYDPVFKATLGLSGGGPHHAALLQPAAASSVGAFSAGTGNIGAFSGLANASPTNGTHNIGVFNGNANGGYDNGNGNIGAFNGNLNGLNTPDPSSGGHNGDFNLGAFNGNNNGNNNAGPDSGAGNGVGNIGFNNGNSNGNGPTPGGVGKHGPAPSAQHGAQLKGGFDTVVAGDGSNSIKAVQGFSTIVAGDGDNAVEIAGSYNTVVLGNGKNVVGGVHVDHAVIVAGDGGDTIKLLGSGGNWIVTGSGDDVVRLSGSGNVVNPGGALTYNAIYGARGADTYVIDAGAGYDRIYDFSAGRRDVLDLRPALAATEWTGRPRDLTQVLSVVTKSGDTIISAAIGPDGQVVEVAQLVGVRLSLSDLAHHSILS
ncbi:type I secretion C-terminal target domain-containing protein [Alsobacter sp. KACC 23698]|uniref:Type I secretion C-terminal target domain-containing protein n=1 Tax=Alsobacter sp. KACC 23698 TaxID=3149229 RepID=A0AAU7JJL6_9HYPH